MAWADEQGEEEHGTGPVLEDARDLLAALPAAAPSFDLLRAVHRAVASSPLFAPGELVPTPLRIGDWRVTVERPPLPRAGQSKSCSASPSAGLAICRTRSADRAAAPRRPDGQTRSAQVGRRLSCASPKGWERTLARRGRWRRTRCGSAPTGAAPRGASAVCASGRVRGDALGAGGTAARRLPPRPAQDAVHAGGGRVCLTHHDRWGSPLQCREAEVRIEAPPRPPPRSRPARWWNLMRPWMRWMPYLHD
jgi:hypothetical protein